MTSDHHNANSDEGSQPQTVDSLGMSTNELREMGHWVVDAVVDHAESLARIPAVSVATPGQLAGVLVRALPEAPSSAHDAFDFAVSTILSNMQHGDHPRYFARVPSPSSYSGVLGDWLATGFNAIATSWSGGSGPTSIELVVIDWLRQLLNMPAGTEGVALNGGSMANVTGLIAARSVKGHGMVYLSDQTHASIARGLLSSGWSSDEIRILPSDDHFQLSVDELNNAIKSDRERGLEPRIVVATAGSTNCGAVDPLNRIADLCATENMWMHVDGAYGAAAVMCEQGRELLSGLERADSLVLDPHKWLFQPYDLGCLLVRHPGVLNGAFSMSPDYLADTTAHGAEVDLRDRSMELTRPARALKLWLSLTIHGSERFRAAILRGIQLAEYAESVLRVSEVFEVVTPAQLAMVTFTHPSRDLSEHTTIARVLLDSGFGAVTSSQLHSTPVLRMCTINPRTTEDDIAKTIRLLEEAFRLL